MKNPKHKKNLTGKEFADCMYLYEKRTGGRWIYSYVKVQEVWVQAFEDAKEYFQEQKQ